MKVIVDTDIWSEAFRRREEAHSDYVFELRSLIEEGRVQMIGIIRMEILCGLRETSHFEKIEKRLRSFPDRELGASIFVQAARFFNLCQSKGIQGSNNDFLLCACSMNWQIPILSKDKDFLQYKKFIPIDMVSLRER